MRIIATPVYPGLLDGDDAGEPFTILWPEGWRIPVEGDWIAHESGKFRVRLVEFVVDDRLPDSEVHVRLVPHDA